jgi:hypothetical protein
VLLTPAVTLRSPIATAPLVAAMTLLVWRTSPRPAVSHSRHISSSSSSISISCEYAEMWLRERPGLRPKTVVLYNGLLKNHIAPTAAVLSERYGP